MGFLRSLFGGGREQPAPTPEAPPAAEKKAVVQLPPDIFSGMKVEVLTMTNSLLFVGKVSIQDGGILEVRSESDGALPQVMYNQEIKLRCFKKNSQTITLQGNVCRSSIRFWHVENVKALQTNQENRNFFRQTAQIPATLLPNGYHREQDRRICTILDISASGVRVQSGSQYSKDAMLLLDVTLIPEEPPFSITCQVRRITPQADGWEYGCQFVGLPEKEQNRLLQTIFVLQRKILQSKRD